MSTFQCFIVWIHLYVTCIIALGYSVKQLLYYCTVRRSCIILKDFIQRWGSAECTVNYTDGKVTYSLIWVFHDLYLADSSWINSSSSLVSFYGLWTFITVTTRPHHPISHPRPDMTLSTLHYNHLIMLIIKENCCYFCYLNQHRVQQTLPWCTNSL